MRTLTSSEAILIGDELHRILGTDAFATAVEILRDDYVSRIVQSAPDQQENREEAYRRVSVLNDLIATMNSLAVAATQIKLVNQLDEEERELQEALTL